MFRLRGNYFKGLGFKDIMIFLMKFDVWQFYGNESSKTLLRLLELVWPYFMRDLVIDSYGTNILQIINQNSYFYILISYEKVLILCEIWHFSFALNLDLLRCPEYEKTNFCWCLSFSRWRSDLC